MGLTHHHVLGVLAMISTSCARLRKLLLARKLQSRSPKPQEEGSNGAPQPSSAETGSVDGLSSPAAKPDVYAEPPASSADSIAACAASAAVDMGGANEP